ncbi:DUF6894 family protein [Methylobacterium fujisawaense]|uniref:DUF6894 family protein n=1 Tax=Methylobacterium fujisawaense TaxID=107400 RepID=UPI00313B1F65
MSRFFFDVHDGTMHLDEFGMESINLEDARSIGLRLLSELNRDDIAKGCDRYALTVLISDEDHHPVYTATLSLTGIWLLR